MNTALMRFQDYTWKHNPKTIQVACRREIKEWKLPGQGNPFAGSTARESGSSQERGNCSGKIASSSSGRWPPCANREEPA